MNLKKDLALMQIFNLMNVKKVTPNQFYLLYCMRENVQSVDINIHQEIRTLYINDFLIQKDINITTAITPSIEYKITSKGEELLSEVESYFKVQKKKTSVTIMGTDFAENLIKYNELFPKLKLPSGKLARAAIKNLETNFKWFFENHEYSWNTIFRATAGYVDEYQAKGWKFMRTSMYFIKKQEQDKTITSDLADYCAMLDSGGVIEEPNHFTDKVT